MALSKIMLFAQEGTELTVVTHDSFAISEEVLEVFEQETGISVRVLRAGDAGTMVNLAILSQNSPLGDVIYGIDNTFLTRALEADLFVSYRSALLDSVDEYFILDPEYRVTPINYGDVCLNYDVAYFDEHSLEPPAMLSDLAAPEYDGLLVVEHPASSSPGLAFLLTTIATFGTSGDYTYLDFWEELKENNVLVVDSWTDAYYGEFSATGGDRPLVVSYASSPPAEVYFAEQPLAEAPTRSIVSDGTCFRQIEFAGIVTGTPHQEAAEMFIDFMLDKRFQEDIPLQMFVFPVNHSATLPEVFSLHASVPDKPVTIGIADIETSREDWIEAWATVVLR